mgnify:CR=1 FL=1
MSSIVNFTYDQKGIEDIRSWNYGTNWPIVYIIYNDSRAYVGELLTLSVEQNNICWNQSLKIFLRYA